MAHAAAAGGADEFQARIGRDLLSRFPPANYDLEQPIRHLAESSGGTRQQRLAGERTERRLLRGFPDHRIAHTSAKAPFHDHTATGKLNAVMTPTGDSGCQVS